MRASEPRSTIVGMKRNAISIPRRERRGAPRCDDYATMSEEEREEVEAIRLRGPSGERDFMLKRAADRAQALAENRPLRLWRYVAGNGWFANGRQLRLRSFGRTQAREPRFARRRPRG